MSKRVNNKKGNRVKRKNSQVKHPTKCRAGLPQVQNAENYKPVSYLMNVLAGFGMRKGPVKHGEKY